MSTSHHIQAWHSFVLLFFLAILTGCAPEFTGQTTDDRYEVSIQPKPNPIPLNTLFTLEVKVKKKEGSTLQAGSRILVDATMPDHNHGMNTLPVVRPGHAPGSYVAEGLLFHMPGRWEISVRIEEGDVISEAKFTVTL